MPIIIRNHTTAYAVDLIARTPEADVRRALAAIAASAADPDESGNDTAAVVYEQLSDLGLVIE